VKDWLAKGRFPEREGEVVQEKHYAKFHHAQPGDPFIINAGSYKVVGLLASYFMARRMARMKPADILRRL
jgi:hypothetical protein